MTDERAELERAHRIIACLVHQVGGRVEIPAELLAAIERNPLVQIDTWPGGGMTLTSEGVAW